MEWCCLEAAVSFVAVVVVVVVVVGLCRLRPGLRSFALASEELVGRLKLVLPLVAEEGRGEGDRDEDGDRGDFGLSGVPFGELARTFNCFCLGSFRLVTGPNLTPLLQTYPFRPALTSSRFTS